jgi:hypothetical protein
MNIRSKKSEHVRNIDDDVLELDIEKEQEEPIPISNDIMVRYAKKDKKILLRKKELFDHLSDKKLRYIKNGICDSYIKYGTPSLNDVISDIHTKSEIQLKRLERLIRRLKKEGEVYDENVSYYNKYVKYGGNIDHAIEEGIKEWFYINKTNYLELLKIYKEEDKAQAKAFNQYIKRHGSDKYTEKIRKTEMVLRLY